MRSSRKNEQGEKLVPLFQSWDRGIEVLCMALITVASLFVIKAICHLLNLPQGYNDQTYMTLGGLVVATLATPPLAQIYAVKRGIAFGTRAERLKAALSTPFYLIILQNGLGWGIAMWIVFSGANIAFVGFHPAILTFDLPIWLGAGLLFGALSTYLSRW